MLTNPKWNIHRDYEIGDVLIPDAVNQLVSSIPYDYVITQEMLDWGATNAMTTYGIDIAKVLNHGDSPDITGMTAKTRITIFIDANMSLSTMLNFRNLKGTPWYATDADHNMLEIYSRSGFIFTGRSATTYIHNTYVTRVGIKHDLTLDTSTLYIGVLELDADMTWNGTLIYEDIYGDYTPTGTHVSCQPWMTNRIGGVAGDTVLVKYDTSNADANYNDIMAIFGDGKVPVVYIDGTVNGGFATNRKYLYPVQTELSCCVVFIDATFNGYYFIYLYEGHAYWQSSSIEGSNVMAGKEFVQKPTFIIQYNMYEGTTTVDLGNTLLTGPFKFNDILILIRRGIPPVLKVYRYNVNVTNELTFYTESCTYDKEENTITWQHIYYDGTHTRLISFMMFYSSGTTNNISWSYWESNLSTT